MTNTTLAVVFVLVLIAFAMGYGVAYNELEDKLSKHKSEAELLKQQLEELKANPPPNDISSDETLEEISYETELWHTLEKYSDDNVYLEKRLDEANEENQQLKQKLHELQQKLHEKARPRTVQETPGALTAIMDRDRTIQSQARAIQIQNNTINHLSEKVEALKIAYNNKVSETNSYKKSLDTYFLNQMDIINDTAQTKQEEISKKEQLIVQQQEESQAIIAENEARSKALIEEQEAKSQAYIEEKEATLKKALEDHQIQYPWLAKRIADLEYAKDLVAANQMLTKKRPAIKASAKIQELSKEKRDLREWSKILEHQLNFYEKAFPWLEEIKESDVYEVWESTKKVDDIEGSDEAKEYHRMKKWLSPEEYAQMSQSEKYQLALDRYQKRNKSNWEVGIEFERYIGSEYEMTGAKVIYNGALKGLEDMGRDLIVESDDKIQVIQCKRWAKEKLIHEKHIFQLYGSVVLLSLTNPDKPLEGLLVTTAPLSETARQCADYLHIGVRLIDPSDLPDVYPVIKCNISRRNGEKIYHLPFDQQYDKVNIEPEKGEFYATTIAEAEAAGFRRAWRHTKIS